MSQGGEIVTRGAGGRGGRGREGRGAPPCEGADTQRGEHHCPPAVPSPSHLHVVILKQKQR